MSTLLCPLCKRSSNQEHHFVNQTSRLCSECCSLIATIMPQSSTAEASSRTPPALSEASLAVPIVSVPIATPAFTPVYVAETAENFSAVPAAPPPFEITPSGDFATAESTAFPAAARVMESPRFVPPATVGNLAIDRSREPQEAIKPVEVESEIDEDSLAPHNLNSPKSAKHLNTPVIDDVPPGWDNTLDQYPLLLVPQSRAKTYSTRQTAVLTLLVLVGLAAGFFSFKAMFTSNADRAAEDRQINLPAPVVQNQSATSAPVEKPLAQSSTTAAQKTETKADSAPVSNDKPEATLPAPAVSEGEGNLTLQAAYLSSATNATAFVDKLKKAGIPAYVSPSGSKFKILIGRFSTEVAAQRYMSTARERAKSVGVDLQELLVNKE